MFESQLGPFQVRSVDTEVDLPATEATGQRQWIAMVELETFETGIQTIPPLSVSYRLPGAAGVTDPTNQTRGRL